MKRKFVNGSDSRPTKAEKLLHILKDGHSHNTKELARKVGHTFGVAKFHLVHDLHFDIEVQRHPTKPPQWQYRLAPELMD